jgi:hypothetical protein
MRSVVVPELEDLEGLSPRQLERVLIELDMVRRQVDAMVAEIVGVAERTVAYVEDGHASVTGWVKATCNWSGGEAKATAQTARLLHALPEVREAAHSGALGLAQTRLLARLHANPRCSDQLADSAAMLVGHATTLPYEDFGDVVRRWEALADTDGAHANHERAHNLRNAHVNIIDERVYLDAQGGVIAGTAIREIFERFCDAEFHADWDTGVAQWGDTMTPALLARSAGQRRFDALLAVFTTAAASGKAGTFDPLVNIVVDQTTYEHHLTKLLGGTPPPLDPETVAERRCETTSGHQIDPDDMLTASFTGHVRRVVFDTAGVVIDLGRRSRLFTGGARDAVLLGNRRCLWPGCDKQAGRCQTDHSEPWADNGPTSPDNGGPMCPAHNRHKSRGYRTWRDPTGLWHTYRPDGTEIGCIGTPRNDTAA